MRLLNQVFEFLFGLYFILQIPSFFETLESPAVAEYKHQQELALAKAVASQPANAPKATKSKLMPLESFIPGNESDTDSDYEAELETIAEDAPQRYVSFHDLLTFSFWYMILILCTFESGSTLAGISMRKLKL